MGQQYDARGAPPCEPPAWHAADVVAASRRGARGRGRTTRFALGCAVRMVAASLVLGRAAASRQPQVLTPLLGVSREGTTVTFHTSQPASFTVLQDGGKGEYQTLERTTTSLTLRAGHAGGGTYTIRARVLTPACTASPAALSVGGHTCQFDAQWRILFPWQSHLLSLLLLLLLTAVTVAAVRLIRVRCCPQQIYDADDAYEGKRRVRSPSPLPDIALERERQL